METEWRSKIFSNVIDATVIMDEKNRLEMQGYEVVVEYEAYFDRWTMKYRKQEVERA